MTSKIIGSGTPVVAVGPLSLCPCVSDTPLISACPLSCLSFSGTPIKTIFSPHAHGVQALDLSADALYIVTLSHVSMLQLNQNESPSIGWNID